MPAPDMLLQFFFASILLGLAPGPDNIYVLTQSAIQGRSAGIVVTMGLCSGLIVHTALVVMGVAALIQASELLFTILKLGGAGYLLYLAYQAFRADGAEIGVGAGTSVAYRDLYLRGVLMNISNPKVSIFFLAFLPQFVQAQGAEVPQQMLVLGGVFILATLLVFNSIALAAAYLAAGLRNSRTAQVVLYRITGAVLALLALRLLVYQV